MANTPQFYKEYFLRRSSISSEQYDISHKTAKNSVIDLADENIKYKLFVLLFRTLRGCDIRFIHSLYLVVTCMLYVFLYSKRIQFPAYESIPNVIAQLYYKQHKIVILSYSPRPKITSFLEYYDLTDYITEIYAKDDLPSKNIGIKPWIGNSSKTPDRIYLVGDLPGDIAYAKMYEIVTSIGFTKGWGTEQLLTDADHIVSSWKEIEDIIIGK